MIFLELLQASRLKQVSDQLNALNSLCLVLGLDVKDKICEICPTMVNSTVTKDVSDNTIKNLTSEIQSLREVKIHRMQKVSILVLILRPVKYSFISCTISHFTCCLSFKVLQLRY